MRGADRGEAGDIRRKNTFYCIIKDKHQTGFEFVCSHAALCAQLPADKCSSAASQTEPTKDDNKIKPCVP